MLNSVGERTPPCGTPVLWCPSSSSDDPGKGGNLLCRSLPLVSPCLPAWP